MKRSVLFVLGAITIIMFQNCAQSVNFRTEEITALSVGSNGEGSAPADGTGGTSAGDSGAGDSSPGNDGSVPSQPSNGPEFSEVFKVTFNSESAPLDMMWVIDNSGSMSQEAAAVRKNFDAFLTALNKTTNFRLLVISQQSDSGYGVVIPSSFDPNTHRQINQAVGSTNGPTLLLNNLKTLPAGFLRQDSKKIVVFVTDDNSSIAAETFMSTLLVDQKWNARDVSVSSFIGLGAAESPCQAKEGLVYKSLATQSGGRNYNICNADWSASFSDLIDSSVSKAVRRFTITSTAEVKEIVEVKADGVVLDKALYSLSGKVVTVADSVNLSENSQVVIRFK